LPDFPDLPSNYPFNDEQVSRIAKTEPTLRDMLQQFRHLFDHLVYGEAPVMQLAEPQVRPLPPDPIETRITATPPEPAPAEPKPAEEVADVVKSVIVVKTPEAPPPERAPVSPGEMWDQEVRAARRKLEPDGALTGATREVQAGLGAFLKACHENGVKVGPWRLQHVVNEWTFGEHPTFGVLTIAHWACRDGQPWKLGIGLFLGRGNAKPKDLITKLSSLEVEPAVIDHLILLRPDDDVALTGKSKAVWQDAEKRGRHARVEAVGLDGFAALYGFPRFLTAMQEAQPDGQPLPNLADLLQEKCERLLEQVCLPVAGG
jgi:hypothetical protein